MYITRHMEKPVMELNEQYPVLLLTGPRQVGKTTMLEHLIEVEGKGRKKVSLDDLTLRELAKTDPKISHRCSLMKCNTHRNCSHISKSW